MNSNPPRSALTLEEIRVVSPALERYTRSAIGEGLWKRPDLSARDRSIVTVAALVARNQTIGMLHYFNLALDNGVKPGELSEIITHLAFYAGWSNALSAVAITKDIFEQRGIGLDQLPPASPELLPLNEAAEAERASYSLEMRKSSSAVGLRSRLPVQTKSNLVLCITGDQESQAGSPCSVLFRFVWAGCFRLRTRFPG
jgi:alkylhydroperoxidase/carboxymuconolactone decarboxylase family protein YurZ